jgi:predicted 3-demethylubiquinone-9 3-methyltransferase (glyoxalase superfamily)
MQPSIVPNLWFDTESEEAARFYCSVFPDSRIVEVTHYTDAGPREAGLVLSVEYELNGMRFVNINGGDQFPHSEAVSFLVECETQDEIDRYWDALVEGGGEHGPCGWLKDRFGVSWQVAPRMIKELVENPNAMAAMLKMGKIDIAALQAAAS